MEWWELVLILTIAMPIVVLWIGCIIDAIGRPDINGLIKALWVLAILFFPIIGSIVYIILRPNILVDPRLTPEEQVYMTRPESIPSIDNPSKL